LSVDRRCVGIDNSHNLSPFGSMPVTLHNQHRVERLRIALVASEYGNDKI